MSKTALEQTKGKIKLVGIVAGISNENAKREGYTKTSEKAYKSITFFVQTSKSNRVKIELFGMVKDQVSAYSQKAKTTKKIDWAKRNDNHGDYKVLGVNLYLEKGEDGKNIRKVMVEYDAIDYIVSNLKDGDVVRIGGQIDFQEYEDKQGKKKETQKFNFNSITKLDEALDFDSPDFKEESKFEQEIVVTDTMKDEEKNTLIVSAKVIKYGGETANATFVVNANDYPKLANNMANRFSYGDFIKVFGHIINSVILTENTEDTTADEDDWGGDDEIKKDFENNYIRDYLQELRITSVDSSTYEPKKYNEDDLESEDEDNFNGNVDGEDTGDDFNDDSDELPSNEEEIDDLPFE
ncbi:hypothetical protein [Brevibacillus laterosporus]|uniref:hypothetical protein n=1 Tax=Brevibacillus laterosporus TaxID=1465 RepID=UPI00215CA2EA|nr:hypothetical protein [Brevibacillus laterosporus]MCR8994585.1 hypothetical protein [Brevibacillus laterosporus]